MENYPLPPPPCHIFCKKSSSQYHYVQSFSGAANHLETLNPPWEQETQNEFIPTLMGQPQIYFQVDLFS